MNNKIIIGLKNIQRDTNEIRNISNIIENSNNLELNEVILEENTFPFLYSIENITSVGFDFFYDVRNDKFIDGLDINNKNQDGKTVLMALAEKGLHNEVVRLIRAGSDWAAQDNSGKTAKDYAYDWCHGGSENEEEEREWDILSIFEELEKEKNNK